MTDSIEPLLWVGSQKTFDDPPKGFWVAVPVLLWRIIVEVPPDIPDSDPFARAIVNLTAAGVQRVADIGELIGIEDLGFVNEVIRRLVDRKVVTLESGVVELAERSRGIIGAVGEKKVWYGIQEVYFGSLWPRAAAKVNRPEFDDGRHVVELGSPGKPAKRNYWPAPAGFNVDEPDAASVTQALIRHLSDLRTIGIKSNSVTAQHLAFLGRPERHPVFSARLGPSREEARLLVRLEAKGGHISVVDPFEVGAWFELARWTEQLLEHSPALRDRMISWANRVGPSANLAPDDNYDSTRSTTDGMLVQPEVTLSRPEVTISQQEQNTLLLSLADRFRDEIRRAKQSALELSHDSDRDTATLQRQWATFGFRIPRQIVRPVPALIKRAAEGSPADLHTLFYAWSLLVDLPDGKALAIQAPDLPTLLYDIARGRSQLSVPDLRPTAGKELSFPTESRY